VFRRRSSDAPDVLDADQAPQQADDADDADYGQSARSSLTPKKAGPTPKRSAAEANRRAPYRAPADRKTASREGKQRDRTERTRRAEALQRGEEWAIPAKDRGPVRGLARDVVDSRHGLSEYYLIAVLPIFVLIFLHIGDLQLVADGIVILILVIVVGEGYYVGRRVERLAKERFPGKSTRGVKLYSAMRSTQMRRLRMPKPRVNRGDPV
jgi:Protein of unknown function (DUF3043)